jgi:UrcA family protein
LSRLSLAVPALALLFSASAASAATDAQELDFRYDKSDLATPTAVAKLYDRIVTLADGECRMISNPPMLNPRAKQCSKELADQLVGLIDAPVLTSYAKQRISLAAVDP